MSRTSKIVLFSILLIIAIADQRGFFEERFVSNNDTSGDYSEYIEKTPCNDAITKRDFLINNPRPTNGFSPYDAWVGRGVYNNNSNNSFKIENSNQTDAVVLLVNAYSERKIRNEYIRKGQSFDMTGVPNGTYYLQWTSGNTWDPNKTVGSMTGGFICDESFTKTQNSNDWMTVRGDQIWTVTLYSVTGGDVESEDINAFEFSD